MINDVSCEQLNSGIVEKIDDVDQFVSNEPNCSFMAHMPIFKLEKETIIMTHHNDLGEITSVTVRKGNNRETVTRHVSSVIPLLSPVQESGREDDSLSASKQDKCPLVVSGRPSRKAAVASRAKTAELISHYAI